VEEQPVKHKRVYTELTMTSSSLSHRVKMISLLGGKNVHQ
jgi:hypothetical protein